MPECNEILQLSFLLYFFSFTFWLWHLGYIATKIYNHSVSLDRSYECFFISRGYLTRFWTGTCHRSFKNMPVRYTNLSKMYARLCTNFSKIYAQLYTNFSKCIPDPIPIAKIAKIDTVPYTKIDNWSLLQVLVQQFQHCSTCLGFLEMQ